MSSRFKKHTQPHGGKRPGSGAPKGPRRKRRKLSYRRTITPTPQERRNQMRDNYKNKKLDKFQSSNMDKDEKIEMLQSKIDELHNVLGQFINREEIEILIQKMGKFNDQHELKNIQFNLILSLLYKSRVSFVNLHQTVITIWSIMKGTSESEVKKQLLSSSSMIRWGRFRVNFFIKLVAAAYAIIALPSSGIMYKNDGTERNNNNLMGHVLEFKLGAPKESKFKKCIINGVERDIKYFSSYERNANVYRMIFSYNESIGKTAENLKICTDQAFEDVNHYIKLWESKHLKPYLVRAFGEENLNFSPLNLRITAFGHDRHSVKYIFYNILAFYPCALFAAFVCVHCFF